MSGEALRVAQRRSHQRAMLVVRPECPKAVPLTRAHLKAALLKGEPVIVVQVGEISLPTRREALLLLGALPVR